MGRIIRHIADDQFAAVATDAAIACRLCAVAGPVFRLYGVLGDSDDARYWHLCRQCAAKLRPPRSQRLSIRDHVAHVVRAGIGAGPGDEAALLSAFEHVAPGPFFAQFFDWPACCGQPAEYHGEPAGRAELQSVLRHATYWERGPRSLNPWGWSPEHLPGPEFDPDLECSMYACLNCRRRYWVFQTT